MKYCIRSGLAADISAAPSCTPLLGQANYGKYALMICVELSSVHTTFEDNINDAILHAIFADGCAAAVLKGSRKSDCPKVRCVGGSSVVYGGMQDSMVCHIWN